MEGDRTILTEILRDSPQLDQREWALLAKFTEEGFKRGPGRPRQKANRPAYYGNRNDPNPVRRAAADVRFVKAEVKKAGYKNKDEEGRSVADRVVDKVVEAYANKGITIPLEALLTELKRSKQPKRKSRKNRC